MNRRRFLGLTGAATLSAVTGATLAPRPETDPSAGVRVTSRGGGRSTRFPNVPLLTHDGAAVRFYDDLVRDKTVLLNFIYTSCEDDCPLTTANLRKVQELLGERAGREVFFYSITLDPEVDTPATLARYARIFDAGPGWSFLTGSAADVRDLRRSLGLVDPDPRIDADKDSHIGMIWFGIEPLERWAACPALSSPSAIYRYLSWIDPNGLRPEHAA